MPSLAAKQAMMARGTSEVALALLTVTHPSLPGGVLYVVNNTEPIVSQGHTHIPAPFGFEAPKAGGTERQTARIVIFDFTRVIAEELEQLAPAEITSRVSVVRASAPDTIEQDYPSLRWLQVDFDQGPIITAELEPIYGLTGVYPAFRFDVSNFQGLF